MLLNYVRDLSTKYECLENLLMKKRGHLKIKEKEKVLDDFEDPVTLVSILYVKCKTVRVLIWKN